MSAQGLFKGIAVVIDDQLSEAGSEIDKIVSSIKEAGGHVVGLEALPTPAEDLRNFGGASFFIMDWNLHGSLVGEGIRLPPAVLRQQLAEKVKFLSDLKINRLAPVFIFTADDPETVMDALHTQKELYQKDEPSHIFVLSKSVVLEKGVFAVLNEWVQSTPSALVLKTWEHEYERAKNAMFQEFYSRSIYWPALLWNTFEADGVPASDELGRVITRNLFSRMTPFHLDLSGFSHQMEEKQKADPEEYRKVLVKVLEGERFVRKDGLHEDSIAPGDVFKSNGSYWINIRPDCDCVIRGEMGDVELYLLKGKKLSEKDISSSVDVMRGSFAERDDEVIVFAMHDGHTVTFKLKQVHLKKWSEIKKDRIGRLLSPFLTRVQQRYSAYLQRPGLPKIPKAALPAAIVTAAEAALQAKAQSKPETVDVRGDAAGPAMQNEARENDAKAIPRSKQIVMEQSSASDRTGIFASREGEPSGKESEPGKGEAQPASTTYDADRIEVFTKEIVPPKPE